MNTHKKEFRQLPGLFLFIRRSFVRRHRLWPTAVSEGGLLIAAYLCRSENE